MTAGEVCGKVLRSEQQWEHWISRFTENGKYDEITPHIPANLASPLPSAVYEEILIHYVATDRYKLRELLEQWATTLFDVTSVVSAIEDKLPELEWNSDEWRMVIESLAQLYLASGRYREALRCYIQLGDAETTMALIKQYHLLEAIGEDIAALILLHVPKEMLHKASKEELEAATSDIISLLVSGARNGLIRPETVIDQLQNTEWSVFLYFYLKALWKPKQEDGDVRRGRFGYHHILEANAPSSPTGALRADEGRAVVEQFADTAVEVFANYDREMLRDLLQSSTAYSYSAA
ncbi:Vacuolar protein sorting-associated protein 41, partial [Ascosphaera atra]